MKELMMRQLAKAAFGEVCAVYDNLKRAMPGSSVKERAVMAAALFGAMRGVSDVCYEAFVGNEPHLLTVYETARNYATDSWNKHKGATDDAT